MAHNLRLAAELGASQPASQPAREPPDLHGVLGSVGLMARRLLSSVANLATSARVTVIMVTHRLSEARRFTRHLVMLEAGRLVEAGPNASSVRRRPSARVYLASDGGPDHGRRSW